MLNRRAHCKNFPMRAHLSIFLLKYINIENIYMKPLADNGIYLSSSRQNFMNNRIEGKRLLKARTSGLWQNRNRIKYAYVFVAREFGQARDDLFFFIHNLYPKVNTLIFFLV